MHIGLHTTPDTDLSALTEHDLREVLSSHTLNGYDALNVNNTLAWDPKNREIIKSEIIENLIRLGRDPSLRNLINYDLIAK